MKVLIKADMLFFAAMLALSCVQTLASGHEENGINWWKLGSQYSEAPALGWLIITFLIFIIGMAYVIKKPFAMYLEIRAKDIRRQIEEGQRAKKESQEKLRAYEEKLSSLDHEITKMRAIFLEQAQAEQKERERLAKELETRIINETQNSIRADFERRKNRLAKEVIEKALLLAEEKILHHKCDVVDENLRRSFVKELKSSDLEVHS